MSGSVGIGSKVIAFILASLLVILMPFALLAWDIGRVLFNPQLVKSILADEVTQSDLIPVSLEWFSRNISNNRSGDTGMQALTGDPIARELISLLDRKDWEAIQEEVMPDEILTDWVSATVDSLYAWIDSDDQQPQIIWNMQLFKERINTEHGVNVILLAYDNLAVCTEKQLVDFAARLASEPVGTKFPYTLCKFPSRFRGEDVNWYVDQFGGYKSSLQTVVQNIPPQLNLTGSSAQNENAETEANKRVLRSIRAGMSLSWLLIIFPLGLILVLVGRSPESLARWWGIPLLVCGFLTLLPGLVYRGLVQTRMMVSPSSDMPPIFTEEINRIIIRFSDAAFRPLRFQAFVLLLAGAGLLIWLGMSLRQKKQTGVVPVMPPS